MLTIVPESQKKSKKGELWARTSTFCRLPFAKKEKVFFQCFRVEAEGRSPVAEVRKHKKKTSLFSQKGAPGARPKGSNLLFLRCDLTRAILEISERSPQSYGGLEIRAFGRRISKVPKLCVVKDIPSGISHVEFQPIPLIGSASAALSSFCKQIP